MNALHTNLQLILSNFEFKFPHPITVLNPHEWNSIDHIKVEEDEKIWVRSKDSMWFNLEQCNYKPKKWIL